MSEFYIVDLRSSWTKRPYVTLWRPDNAGYAYSLPWAGKYDEARVRAGGDYYTSKEGGRFFVRFPVPCEIVERLAMPEPRPGIIDGNVGPVVINTRKIRSILRRARAAGIADQGGNNG